MHDTERTANLLGAASLALTDRALSQAVKARSLSANSAAALVSLLPGPGLSVSELGRRVKLTQPAAARMVDSLEADGFVERVPNTVNRRWVTVRTTEQGTRLAKELLQGRNEPLLEAVTQLSESEQVVLASLLEKILTQIYRSDGQGQRICRFCDRGSCTRTASCPIGEAERAEE